MTDKQLKLSIIWLSAITVILGTLAAYVLMNYDDVPKGLEFGQLPRKYRLSIGLIAFSTFIAAQTNAANVLMILSQLNKKTEYGEIQALIFVFGLTTMTTLVCIILARLFVYL